MEYVTKYPKTVSLEGDENNEIHVDKMTGVEELHLIGERRPYKWVQINMIDFSTDDFSHTMIFLESWCQQKRTVMATRTIVT